MKDYWIGIIMGFFGSLVVIFTMLAMMPEAMEGGQWRDSR